MRNTTKIFVSFAFLKESLELFKDVIIEITGNYISNVKTNVLQDEVKEIEPSYRYNNCVLIPGFINGHIHIGDSFAKELGYNLKIDEIVKYPNGLKHYLLRTIDEEIVIEGIRNSMLEMLYNGITTFVDYRENGVSGIKLLQKADLLFKKMYPEIELGKIILGRPDKSLDELDDVLKYCDGVGLSSTNLYSDDELNEIKNICKKHNKIISVHAAETKEEHFIAEKKYGNSDVYRALLVLEANPIVHSIHINKKDLWLIKSKKCGIVVCPRANSYFGVGFPPIQEFISSDIPLCIGTDNVMANSLNIFREFEYLIKYLRSVFGPKIINPLDVLRMATVNPAKIFKLEDRGWIDKNKRADFIILDLSSPHLQPMTKLAELIVLRAGPRDIKSVFLGGRRIETRK
ncbi:MAG: amidohydrolase family protein [Candidatus Helarchaeota archaeon]